MQTAKAIRELRAESPPLRATFTLGTLLLPCYQGCCLPSLWGGQSCPSLAPGSPLGTPFRRLSPAPALVESFFGLILIHRTAGRQSRESGFIRPSLLGAPPTPALAVKQIGSPAGGSLVKGKNLNPASALLLARIAPGGRSPQTPARAAYYIPFSAAHVKCMGRILH